MTTGGRRNDDLVNHDTDVYAHGQAFASFDRRLTVLEKWQQRIIGAVGIITFIVTVDAGLHWLHP